VCKAVDVAARQAADRQARFITDEHQHGTLTHDGLPRILSWGSPMASCVTVSQCPIGTRWSTASAIQERHTAARVQDVWSLARSTSTSSRPCFVRSRAAFAAAQRALTSGPVEVCTWRTLPAHLWHTMARWQ
jgi:hypothetical protein